MESIVSLWTGLITFSWNTFQDQDAVFFHPSGEEKSLREAIDELRKYNGDRSGKKFWVWVDQVLVIDNISGKCIVKFDKWEQCGKNVVFGI